MRIIAMTLLLLSLCACSEGVGKPGSILWKMTANDSEREHFGDDARTQARLQCAAGGYSGTGYEACVENSMKY